MDTFSNDVIHDKLYIKKSTDIVSSTVRPSKQAMVSLDLSIQVVINTNTMSFQIMLYKTKYERQCQQYTGIEWPFKPLLLKVCQDLSTLAVSIIKHGCIARMIWLFYMLRVAICYIEFHVLICYRNKLRTVITCLCYSVVVRLVLKKTHLFLALASHYYIIPNYRHGRLWRKLHRVYSFYKHNV